jgi:hypothetical protein
VSSAAFQESSPLNFLSTVAEKTAHKFAKDDVWETFIPRTLPLIFFSPYILTISGGEHVSASPIAATDKV